MEDEAKTAISPAVSVNIWEPWPGVPAISKRSPARTAIPVQKAAVSTASEGGDGERGRRRRGGGRRKCCLQVPL